MKRKIMAPDKNEKIGEKNEKMTDRKEKNGEKDAGFLPISFWTD
jgi:hypothetical protein